MAEIRPEDLEHFLPDVGYLKTTLRQESALVYRYLSRSNEISRTHFIAQLGVIQYALEAARHTRWDFTMLLLDLIRRTKDIPSIHVQSKVPLGDGTNASSASELLNTWALLLNAGHLHGTFFTETELLYAIRRMRLSHPQFESQLLSAVPEIAQPWARRILYDESSYNFYQLLAFYRLNKMIGKARGVSYWTRWLASYVSRDPRESPALSRARRLFKSLRRIAFLTLDSSLTPTILEIRISQLAAASPMLERIALPDPYSSVGDELESLEEYLHRDIYNGRESLNIIELLRNRVTSTIARTLDRNGLRQVVEANASSPGAIEGALKRARDDRTSIELRCVIGPPYWQFFRRLSQARYRRRRLEDAFALWATRNSSDARLLFMENPPANQLVFQIHARSSELKNQAVGIAGGYFVVRRLLRSFFNPQAPRGFDELGLGPLRFSLLSSTMQHFLESSWRWEWGAPVSGVRFLCGCPREVAGVIREIASNANVTDSRMGELDALESVAGNMRATWVVASMSNVKGVKSGINVPVVELDGVIVGLDEVRHDVVMTIVEAKRQRKRSEAECKKQFRASIERLELRIGVRRMGINSKAEGKGAYAWEYFRSSYR